MQALRRPPACVGSGPELPSLRRLAGPGAEFLGALSDGDVRACYRRASVTLLPGEEDFGIVPLEAQACGRPVVALGRGGALETVVDGETGVLVADSSPEALADGNCPGGFSAVSRDRHPPACRSVRARSLCGRDCACRQRNASRAGRCGQMVKRYSRWLIALYVASDAVLAAVAFVLAYLLRFETGIIPVTKGLPPFRQYVNILPFVAALVPLAYYLQGLYRVHRSRSRVDDFFVVLVGSVLAVVMGIVSTLYVQTYVVSEELKARAPSRSRSRSGPSSWS